MITRSAYQILTLLALLIVLALTAGGATSAQSMFDVARPVSTADADAPGFRSSPVMFIENAGQWDDGARFQVWGGPAGTMWLAEDAIWITVLEVRETSRPVDRGPDPALRRSSEDQEELAPRRGVNIKLSFVDANPHPRLETFDRLDTTISYFYGDDPDQWRPDVPVWGGVRYAELYRGVDLELASAEGQMALRLTARPDADLGAVAMQVEGAETVTLDGDLLRLSTAVGAVALPLLQAEESPGAGAQVQPISGGAFEIIAPFAPLSASGPPAPQRGPDAPADNPADLLYSTFLGGRGDDRGDAIAVDGTGNAYVTGYTYSSNFPTTPGAFDRSYHGRDAFVVKLNPAGSALAYATFLGGSDSDHGSAIAVDGAGSAYVTGYTYSTNFPTTPGAFDRSHNGGLYDAFVVKLNPAGSGLAYAAFLGGSGSDEGNAIAVDGAGSAYVTGGTPSSDFPTTPGAFDRSHNGYTDAFVVKLNPAGSALAYATFLGGSRGDAGSAIAVDGAGNAYVTGSTGSGNSDFPTTPGACDAGFCGMRDAFVVKLNSAGTALAYATFLGGPMSATGWWNGINDITVDGSGRAYVTGATNCENFPTTPGAFDRSYNGGLMGGRDAFVARLSPQGSRLEFSTFLGGTGEESANSIYVDTVGRAYVVGDTTSADFPMAGNSYDTSIGGHDAFAVRVGATGSTLEYATFLGGTNVDNAFSIALDSSAVAYIAGMSRSPDFPTTSGAYDTTYNDVVGTSDGFIVKLAMGATITPPTPTPPPSTYTISGRVTEASGFTGIPGVTIWADTTRSTITDVNGNYTFTGLPAGTYNIRPSRYLYAFSPSSRTVTVPPNATGQDFVRTPVVDLSVDHIEVAQVFVEQNDPISGTPIPLIAKKDTLVRVYVSLTGAPSVYGVTARLHLRNAFGIEHTITETVNLWPVLVTQTPDPLRLQDTINFRPPPGWLWGKITFWADVDPENRIPETDEDNNTGGHMSKTFEAGKPVRIGITQIGFRSFPWGPYTYADWNTIARADAMLEQVYPVATSDVQYYYQPGESARVQCLWGNQDACWAEFHNQLKIFWRRVDDEGEWVGGTRPHALVGWVSGAARDAGSACGEANRLSPPEVVIADYCDKYSGDPPALTPEPVTRVLAHEVGHLLNPKPELQHAKNLSNKDDPQCNAKPIGQDPLYPTPPSYPMGSIFAHGLDMSNSNPRVLEPKKTPLATYDLMSYCSPAWISPYNYFKLNTGFTGATTSWVSDAEPDALVRKLLVSGLVFTPTLQVELNPFYVLNTPPAADANSGTDYCLETRNASGAVLDKRCFDLAFMNRETYAPASVDGFALAIPYPDGTTQIILTRTSRNQTGA